MDSACTSFQMLLSAYADGEVDARERGQVELHLSGCAECRARLEDLKALSSAVPAALMAQAEQMDFSGFADKVMARVTPESPGLLERLRIGWAEILAYHRTAVLSSAVTAAVTLLIAVPLVYQYASRHVAPEVVLRNLQIDDPRVKPVVLQMESGKTLIMLVDEDENEPGEDSEQTPDMTPEPPKEGEL